MTLSAWDCYRHGIIWDKNLLRISLFLIISQSLFKSLGLSAVHSFLWPDIAECMVWNHYIWPVLRHSICLLYGAYKWSLFFLKIVLADCFSLASICGKSKSRDRGSLTSYFYLIKPWVDPRVIDSAELCRNSFVVSVSRQRLGSNSYLSVRCLPWSQGCGVGRGRGQWPGCLLPRGVPV